MPFEQNPPIQHGNNHESLESLPVVPMCERIFPKTRYQGSKYKLRSWIRGQLSNLNFQTVLDAFGGTGAMSFMFKEMGKTVYYNDILRFNFYIGKALVENKNDRLTEEDVQFIVSRHPGFYYDNFIQRTFFDIYYTDEENQWLDVVTQNIFQIPNPYKQAMAFWALFQSCMIKRPYNLFHRKNLYVRTSDVKRSFGNKTTWDQSFGEHFIKFTKEINKAIFDNGQDNKACCDDAKRLDIFPDLVYIDPPYIPAKGSLTLYRDFYHFLEGLVHYYDWENLIDQGSKHKKLKTEASDWDDRKKIMIAFQELLQRYRNTTMVISYRRDGIPSIEDIRDILMNLGKRVEITDIEYRYVLSSKSDSKEVLMIAQ